MKFGFPYDSRATCAVALFAYGPGNGRWSLRLKVQITRAEPWPVYYPTVCRWIFSDAAARDDA